VEPDAAEGRAGTGDPLSWWSMHSVIGITFRRLALGLAFAALLLAAESAHAVDLVGVTAARFQWTPAAGNVSAYLVYVARNGAAFPAIAEAFTSPSELSVIVQGRPGDRIRVRVAAMGPQLTLGPYSQASDEVHFVAAPDGVPTFDMNGDGASELVFQNGSTGALTRWTGVPTQALTSLSSGLPAGAVWTFVDAGDYDADGKSDVLWRVPGSGRHVLCRSDGLSPRLCADFVLLAAAWSVLGVGDVNLDGRRDVVVRTEGGIQSFVCFGNGFQVSTCGASFGTYDPSAWAMEAPGDQNADGRADLLLHHVGSGVVYTCFFTSAGSMSCKQTASAIGGGFRVLGVGDTDGDSRGEVLFRNAATRTTLVCELAGGLLASCSSLSVESRWLLLGSGDYDGDGRADLVWRDAAAGLVRLDFLVGLAPKGSPLLVPVGSTFRVLAR